MHVYVLLSHTCKYAAVQAWLITEMLPEATDITYVVGGPSRLATRRSPYVSPQQGNVLVFDGKEHNVKADLYQWLMDHIERHRYCLVMDCDIFPVRPMTIHDTIHGKSGACEGVVGAGRPHWFLLAPNAEPRFDSNQISGDFWYYNTTRISSGSFSRLANAHYGEPGWVHLWDVANDDAMTIGKKAEIIEKYATERFGYDPADVGEWCVADEEPTATKSDDAPLGPGGELKRLLSRLGFEATETCSCNKYAKQMDENGPEWCRDNVETIVGWLRKEWTKKGDSGFAGVAKSWFRGMLFSETIARRLVLSSIKKSENKSYEQAAASQLEGELASE